MVIAPTSASRRTCDNESINVVVVVTFCSIDHTEAGIAVSVSDDVKLPIAIYLCAIPA
jgi:hypothetical protein